MLVFVLSCCHWEMWFWILDSEQCDSKSRCWLYPLTLLSVECGWKTFLRAASVFKNDFKFKSKVGVTKYCYDIPTTSKWLQCTKTARCCLKIPWQVWCISHKIFERDPNCVLDPSLLMQLIHLKLKFLTLIVQQWSQEGMTTLMHWCIYHLVEKFLTLIVVQWTLIYCRCIYSDAIDSSGVV